MRGAIKLFRVFGIDIEIHITFLILPLLFGLAYGIRGIFLISFVFLCVTLHELVHSLQAKRFGVRVDQILLLPLGGIASMRSIPTNPRQEFIISISGPLFNLIFAAILFFPLKYLGVDVFSEFPPTTATWKGTLSYMFWINPILAVFNLIPAFPMDGGRVLRSFLAQRMDYGRATRIAVRLGRIFAVLFVVYGLAQYSIWLVLIGFFIFMAASQEGLQADIRSRLKNYYVRDILSERFVTVRPDMPLREVMSLSLRSHQYSFPVVDSGRLIGLLLRSDIIAAMENPETPAIAAQVMRRNFPTVGPDVLLADAQSQMESAGVAALPVVRNNSLIGIIALEDIHRAYMLVSRG